MVQTFDIAFSDGSYDIYNAVYMVAHALHEMLFQQVDNPPMDNVKGCDSNCVKVVFLLLDDIWYRQYHSA